MVNVTAPAAKTNHDLCLVARVSIRKASLSVNSATKTADATVAIMVVSLKTGNAIIPHSSS